MATTYLLTNQAEAQQVGIYQQKMLTSAGSPTTQSTSLAGLALDVQVASWIAPGGAGTLDWLLTISSQIEITTAAADVGVLLLNARVSLNGMSTRGGDLSPAYSYGTGLKTLVTVWGAGSDINTNSGRATTDRLAFRILGRNDNMMTAQTLAWAVNDVDAFVTAPWDVAAPASGGLPPRLASRARQHRIGR